MLISFAVDVIITPLIVDNSMSINVAPIRIVRKESYNCTHIVTENEECKL